MAAAAALVWAVGRGGVGDEIVNVDGWDSFTEFWTAIVDPDLAPEFLRLTVDAAATTLSYAVLGTALALVIGLVGAPLLSELVDVGRWTRQVMRVLFVVPRAVHEIIWALLLVQVFGFDPMVAVLAIGIPFGAVTAKVFAETIDEADPAAFRSLRATGATRLAALLYGVAPAIRGELLSYAFYRLECAIRSAAVLGVIGAGGLGFQLDLSFESLRYDQIWTLIAALMLLSGAVDAWSSTVRRSSVRRVGSISLLVVLALVPWSWHWVGLDPATIWSPRTRRLAGELLGDLFPPRLGPGGWQELIGASLDTVALSILALVIAAIGGVALGVLAGRPAGRTAAPTLVGGVGRTVVRLVLLLFRAVPAPVWAFLAVLVLFPGLWPGAVALGIYNLGVLGRLDAEAIEERDPRPADAVTLTGAGRIGRLLYGTLPAATPRLLSLALYRWEVIVRETVVVGVVGAGGLGQLINEDLAARDFAAVTSAVIALVVISFTIDGTSASLRRALR